MRHSAAFSASVLAELREPARRVDGFPDGEKPERFLMQAYGRLAVMAVLSFIAVYVLMYAMVDTLFDAYPNLNQAYMAGLMTAPVVLIALLLMGRMFPRRSANVAIAMLSVALLAACLYAIRTQAAVGDLQFLKSMIAHHSGAVLMCERAKLTDDEIKRLCAAIIEGQRNEITQMNALIKKLEQ
jgi:uncharacterized membrane protein YqhA